MSWIQLLIASLLMSTTTPIGSPEALDRNLKEFQQRVHKYVQLQRSIKGQQPKISKGANPAQITIHRKAMAEALQASRTQAQPGDIFFEGIKPYFVQVIHDELKGAKGSSARQMIKVGNPKDEGNAVPLRVNAVYPDGAPLSAVPPGLLQKLPTLPPELDYRFVGRNLILRDVDANIIVDFIPEAAPAA